MTTKEQIKNYIKKQKQTTIQDLSNQLNISRQAVHKHIKELVNIGFIEKIGTTKAAYYRISDGQATVENKLRKTFLVDGLEEHSTFEYFSTLLNFKSYLNKNSFDILNYIFTEILNNAIDHSESEKCTVEVIMQKLDCEVKIKDFGIGIFYSIYSKFKLDNEHDAIGELIKGKTTTFKERHSGEGIFFSSKAAKIISFRSHKINLNFDNVKNDIFVEQRKFIKGTEVNFNISRFSKTKLNSYFSKFAPEEYEYRFDKTKVQVKLFEKQFISRSEAKRLLAGLDKFKEIILDFSGVKSIGQGFADEIFRIYKKNNPDILIKTENTEPEIEQMIKHVVDNKY